jgi:hypothetical protein
VTDGEHNHSWGDWTNWTPYIARLDIRERYCGTCPATDEETRPHVHQTQEYGDPYAPVGSGMTMKVCTICQETVR